MSLDIVPLQPIDRGQLQVMRLRAALFGLVLFAGGCVLEAVVLPRVRAELGLPPFGLVPLLAALPGLWLVFGAQRRWKHWGYAFTGRELHVAHGWLTRVHTIVPVVRVQHIDVTQGPLERMVGVAQLVLHTAGTDASQVVLPGIARDRAEAIRDAIRQQIGSAA